MTKDPQQPVSEVGLSSKTVKGTFEDSHRRPSMTLQLRDLYPPGKDENNTLQ